MKILSYISSLFSVKKCYTCWQLWHFFCPKCLNTFYIYKPYCYICKKYSPYFFIHENCCKTFPLRQIVVLTRYRHKGVKKLLGHAKYYGKYQAYKDIIFLNNNFFQKYLSQKNSLLVPIPMHLLRKWKRWYNQSEKIANYLSNIWDIPVNNKILLKKKYTRHQSHLSREKRKENLKDSFILRKNNINKNTTIYLVDDVVSTGSTLVEAAWEFWKKGFTDIRAVILASD